MKKPKEGDEMNIISKIKGCLALAVVAAGFAAWAAAVPTDAQGFDTTAENVAPFYSTTFVPGDYCVVDLTTGKVTEMKDVASAATFNTDDYKTTKMALRYVPAGKFKAVCGKSNNSYKNLVTNDVSLSAYWMAVFPVTEAQYNAVMGGETTSVKPKASISWNDFRGGDWAGWDGTYANVPAPGDGTFVKALNDKVAAAGCKDKFDLCTSFQWERAARAGTRTDYFFSNETAASVDTGEFELLKNYAWYKKNNTPSATKDVGEKLPNAWGLYDVYGNIYENCLDWSSTLDGVTPGIDYAGRATGGFRVYRSGCYIADAGKNSSVYWTQKNPADGADSNGFRLIRKPATSSDPSVVPAISAKSEKFTVDLRGEIALAKGEVTIAGVSYSDTAFGAADAEDVKLDYTNETTGATGELKTGLSGEDVTEVDLPQKDGGYKLTHSTGDLTSFVKFTVSGYPLGSEGNPWKIGANAAADVIAFSNGTGTVTFKPVRGTVTKAGLETIKSAMGGTSFTATKLIAADGSETNDLVMVLGASGTAYDTLDEALAANEASCTLFDVNGYLVSYNGGEGALGTMATDTFIPTVPTNLTANAYEIIGYRFDGWTNAVAGVFYTNRQEGVDFAQPGETLALTALWTQVELEPTGYDELSNMLAKVTRPVTFDLVRDIVIPVGGKIVVPAGKDVTFAGNGKFDVSAERPALFCGYSVGTGLKPEDLDRFRTDKDVKAYYEDGKVVVRGRGETEEFPWLLGTEGHEDEVTAWAIDGGILAKPARGTVSVAALQSVTNALSGYVPGLGELKVISADGTATNNVVMLLGSDGVPYDTLADVLAANPMPTAVKLYEVKGANVEFNAMGGVHTNGLEVITNFCIVTYTLPETPTRTNYTFLGWYDGWTNGAAVVSNGWDLLRYEPHTLYAKWWADKTSKEGEGSEVIGSEVVPGAETATITGAVASVDTEFVIPDRVSNGADGAAVVEIGQEAFCRAKCATAIRSVTTPVHLKKIGVRAFYQQQSLSRLVITPPRKYDNPTQPEDLQICQSAFAGTAIEDVEIPDAKVTIDAYAFQNCKTVKTITFLGDGANVTVHPTAFKLAGRANGTGGLKIYASQTFLVNHPTLVDDVTKGNPSITVYMRPDEGKPISLAFTGSPEILDGGKVGLTLKAGTTAKWASPDLSDLKVYGAAAVDGDYVELSHESAELTPAGEVKVVVTPGDSQFFKATVQE